MVEKIECCGRIDGEEEEDWIIVDNLDGVHVHEIFQIDDSIQRS